MDRNARNKRRVARLAAAALGVVLAMPSFGVANHTDCYTTGVGCPSFDPQFVGDSTWAYTDVPSSVVFRVSQRDHESPIVDFHYDVPKGWQFAVDQVRPAAQSDGVTPATNCTQIYGPPPAAGEAPRPRILQNAEAVASNIGMRVRHTVPDILDPVLGEFRPEETYGFRNNDPSQSTPTEQRRRRPNIAFLNWDPAGGPTGDGQANLCMYLYSDEFNSELPANALEFIVPIQLIKLPAADASYGWRVKFSLLPFIRHPNLNDPSVLFTSVFFNQLTSGNWNRNPVTGRNERITFTETPTTPGDYNFRASFTTCREGINPPSIAAPVCANNNTITIERLDPIQITPPPGVQLHDFSRLTGAGAPISGVGSSLMGFSFRRSADGTVPVSWNPPDTGLAHKVKGYALSISAAGDSANVHWRYYITDKDDPGFAAAEKVCGPLGEDTSCSTIIDFPINAGAKVLGENGTYDFALTTIYTDGHRTDRNATGQRLCDNGTGPGVLCNPADRTFNVRSPGISEWETLMRTDAWPVAYLQTSSSTPPGLTVPVPRYLLLVDYAQKKAEFNFWYVKGPTRTLAATDNKLIGDNASAFGLSNFSSGQLGGTSERFAYEGITEGNGGADGLMTIYNLQGLPECVLTVCGGLPSGTIIQFSTSRKL